MYAGEEKGRIGNRAQRTKGRRKEGRRGMGRNTGSERIRGGKSDVKYRGWESAKEGDV